MRFTRSQYRTLYAAIIILAFFLPAYRQSSAIGFLSSAIRSFGSDSELTLLDLVVALIPLLLVPATSLAVLVRSLKRKPLGSLLLALPFFSLSFFFLIFSFDVNRQVNSDSVLGLFGRMNVGFYLAACASFFLLLTYSRREALNMGSRR